MDIKVQNRQRETLKVHGVSDGSQRSLLEGLNQADPADGAPVCAAPCDSGAPEVTAHQKRNRKDVTQDPPFQHPQDDPATKINHREVFPAGTM